MKWKATSVHLICFLWLFPKTRVHKKLRIASFTLKFIWNHYVLLTVCHALMKYTSFYEHILYLIAVLTVMCYLDFTFQLNLNIQVSTELQSLERVNIFLPHTQPHAEMALNTYNAVHSAFCISGENNHLHFLSHYYILSLYVSFYLQHIFWYILYSCLIEYVYVLNLLLVLLVVALCDEKLR